MDQIKIGKFIAECRVKQELTQLQLAEKLNITDRAVSKWERGKSLPDASCMLELCEILNITVMDLLNGEIVNKNTNEELLLELVKQKENQDKRLLDLEIVIGLLSSIIIVGFNFVASFFEMEAWLRITIIATSFIIGFIGIIFALIIEQTAGYYECKECGHKYVPTFKSVLFAMHNGRSRYMRCPKCHKKSWHKKTISNK